MSGPKTFTRELRIDAEEAMVLEPVLENELTARVQVTIMYRDVATGTYYSGERIVKMRLQRER